MNTIDESITTKTGYHFGGASHYFTRLGNAEKFQHPGGIVYKVQAEIKIIGSFVITEPDSPAIEDLLKVGTFEEGTETLIVFTFIDGSSSVPPAEIKNNEYVNIYLNFSDMAAYLETLENASSIFVHVFYNKPENSFIEVKSMKLAEAPNQ